MKHALSGAALTMRRWTVSGRTRVLTPRGHVGVSGVRVRRHVRVVRTHDVRDWRGGGRGRRSRGRWHGNGAALYADLHVGACVELFLWATSDAAFACLGVDAPTVA